LVCTFGTYFKNPLMMRADLYEHPDYYL